MSKKNQYESLNIRLDNESNALVERLSELTGFSKKEILAYSSQPCGPCGNEDVRVRGKNDELFNIPRGILFNSMLKKHSSYQKKAK